MIVNTQSPAYLNYLSQLQAIYSLFRENYGPVVKYLTKAQLVVLYQRDPLFKEIVDMAKDVSDLAERVEVEL